MEIIFILCKILIGGQRGNEAFLVIMCIETFYFILRSCLFLTLNDILENGKVMIKHSVYGVISRYSCQVINIVLL